MGNPRAPRCQRRVGMPSVSFLVIHNLSRNKANMHFSFSTQVRANDHARDRIKHGSLAATVFVLFWFELQKQYRQALGFAHPPTIGYLTNQLLGILPQPTIGYLANFSLPWQPMLLIIQVQVQHSFYQIFPPPWQPMLLMIQVQVHSFYQFFPPLATHAFNDSGSSTTFLFINFPPLGNPCF